MSGKLKLLRFLKDYTDSEHSYTQEDLRILIRNIYKNENDEKGNNIKEKEIIGNKITFKKNIEALKEQLNDNTYEMIKTSGNTNKKSTQMRIGKVHYNHSLSESELNKLIKIITESRFFLDNEKIELINKLKLELARKDYIYRDPIPNESIDKEIITVSKNKTTDNIVAINKSINKKLLISFSVFTDKHINSKVKSERVYACPYRIVEYNENYYLICRKRIITKEVNGKPTFELMRCIDHEKNITNYYMKYDNFFAIYRIDLIDNINTVSPNGRVIKSKILQNTDNLLDTLINNIFCYKHNTEVLINDLVNDNTKQIYRIEFKVLGKDLSFVCNTFGDFFEKTNIKENIISVQAEKYFFVDFALANIDKIIIVGISNHEKEIKNILTELLETGINNLKSN